jgi:hypothetical protein
MLPAVAINKDGKHTNIQKIVTVKIRIFKGIKNKFEIFSLYYCLGLDIIAVFMCFFGCMGRNMG